MVYLKSIVWVFKKVISRLSFETSPTQFFWLAIVISNCSMWHEDFKLFLK